jgi:hypothetical protein
VRGFWPALGAKSWASAGRAANQSDRCLSLATLQSPQVIPVRAIPLSAVRHGYLRISKPQERENRGKAAFPRKEIFRAFTYDRETPPRSPAAIENTFDEHRIRRDDESNGHAPLESDTFVTWVHRLG